MLNFEQNPNVEAALQRLMSLVGTERGTVLYWQSVDAIMYESHRHPVGRAALVKFIKRMRIDYQLIVRPVPGVGLRFLTDKEAAFDVPNRRLKKARRQSQMALTEVEAVRAENLPANQRLLLSNQKHHLARHRLDLGRTRRAYLNALTNATEVQPRRRRKKDEE
jgi:hypothetical protein